MKPGTLVLPIPVYPRKRGGIVTLTPLEDPENVEWPEWLPGQVGIVLPPEKGQIGVKVMVPDGIGLCFFDEIEEVM